MLPFTLPDSPSYAVAFSGGADSRLLLELTVRALLERLGEEGRSHVIALHLHHGIRGEEADRDEAFCGRVCAELGIELICERVSIPAMAKDMKDYAHEKVSAILAADPVCPLDANTEKLIKEIMAEAAAKL